MPADETIQMVVSSVRDCHRQLTVDGADVILDRQPTASPAAGDEMKEESPPVVLLHWVGQGPGHSYHEKPLINRMPVDQAFRPDGNFNPAVPTFCLVRNEDSEAAGQGPPAVDSVVWYLGMETLELQGDANFTHAKVTNAVAREIALNVAKSMLVGRLDLGCEEGDLGAGDSPLRDPEVIDFTARLKDNIESLMADARLAGVAYSTPPPPFSDSMEDVLRESIAQKRRQEADGSMPSNPAPISADELAAAPPLVLRPFEDIYRGFSSVDIMDVFKKVVLSRNDCCICPGYEVWFEKREGGSRHEYEMKNGHMYCCHMGPVLGQSCAQM